MNDAQAKARFRIMMLIAELQELSQATPEPTEHARIEAILLNAIDALGRKSDARDGRMLWISTPGRA